MAKKFLTPVVPPALSSDPSGVAGGIYYNTSSNSLKFYNGSAWVALAASDGGSSATNLVINLSEAPSSPVKGQVYFNTVENVIKMYNGTSWSDVGGPKALLNHIHNYDGTVGYVSIGEFVPDSVTAYDAGGAYSTTFNDILDGGGA